MRDDTRNTGKSVEERGQEVLVSNRTRGRRRSRSRSSQQVWWRWKERKDDRVEEEYQLLSALSGAEGAMNLSQEGVLFGRRKRSEDGTKLSE